MSKYRVVSSTTAVLLVLVRLLVRVSCWSVSLRAELTAKNRQLQQMELKVEEYKDSLLKVCVCVCVCNALPVYWPT